MSALVKPGWVPGDDEDACEWPDCPRHDAEYYEKWDSWFCWPHGNEAHEENAADTARMMTKEDDLR